MDALGMLNALIGLALVYFVLSLIVSAATEWITQFRGDRGDILKLATARLLGLEATPKAEAGRQSSTTSVPASGAGGDGAAVEAFYAFFAHPQIQALQQDPKRKPSYIPTDTYAAVFAESALGMTMAQMRNAPAVVRTKIEALPGSLKANLFALLDEAEGDPAKLIAGIETWTEKTWDRASGWLRRRLNPRMFLVGLAVAAAANADTVRMFQVLTRNATLQQAMVQTASSLAAQGSDQTLEQVLCQDAAATKQAKSSTESCNLDAARRYALDVSPLLGWEDDVKRAQSWDWYAGKLVGLLITASALLMGAPFWFDMLKKLISVRQSLQPEAPDGKPKPGAGETAQAQGPATGAVPTTAIAATAESTPAFQPNVASFRRENAFWMSRFSGLAYSEQPLAEAQGMDWGYQVSGKFDAVGDDTQYLVAASADTSILAFRGTQPARLPDWNTDLMLGPRPCPWHPDARIHKGFFEALDREWATILQRIRAKGAGRALWITGHSLGGALALLAAHRLTCTEPDLRLQGVITFGQPRCGDAAFAEDVQRRLAGRVWRVVNNRDIVARIPPYASGFRHAGTVIYLDDLGRVAIDPPLWYRALDNLDLPRDEDALRQALMERVADHAIARYSQILANAIGWTA